MKLSPAPLPPSRKKKGSNSSICNVLCRSKTVCQNRVICLWFWVSLGVNILWYFPFPSLILIYCVALIQRGEVVVCCFFLSNSYNTAVMSIPFDSLPTPPVTPSSCVFCLFYSQISQSCPPPNVGATLTFFFFFFFWQIPSLWCTS